MEEQIIRDLKQILEELKDIRRKSDFDFLRIKQEILCLIIQLDDIKSEINEIKTQL